MNANIVLSVRGRKVVFNPHAAYFKWKIMLPIERVEVICEKSHYFERVGYVPRTFQNALKVTISSNEWNMPKSENVVIPIHNNICELNQVCNTLFSNCDIEIHTPLSEITQYIKFLRGCIYEH
jgi:hypothetical protein